MRLPLLLLACLALIGCSRQAPKPAPAPTPQAAPAQPVKPPPEPTPAQADLRSALETACAYDHSLALDATLGPPRADRPPGEVPQDGSYELWEVNFLGVGGMPLIAFLTLPTSVGAAPYPTVLLVHGEGSQKGAMTRRYGALLAARGIASLSLDLPGYADRDGEPPIWDPAELGAQSGEPLDARMVPAVLACRRAIDLLGEHPRTANGKVACLGYGTGAYVGLETAVVDSRIAAIALCGIQGESPGTIPSPADDESDPTLIVSREWVQIPHHDLYQGGDDAPLLADYWLPTKVIPLFAGRPLMIQNGRHDASIDPALAAQLYDAAGEPKTQRWYDADHQLNADATRDAVAWLAEQLGVAPN